MANFEARVIHKYMYPATYNFKDEADGTSGTDIEFVDTETGDDSTYSAVIVASEDGHRKVIQFDAAGDNGKYAYWQHDHDDQTADGTTIEYWAKYIDNGQGYFLIYWYGIDSGQLLGFIYFNSANNKLYWAYGNGAGGTTTGSASYAADTWHHIRLSFDFTNDNYDLYVNGILIAEDKPFYNDRTDTGLSKYRFQLDTGGGANALQGFVDAVGHSWDTDYNIGDNVHDRHYRDQDSDFESEDWGTEGASISFVGSVAGDGTVTIIPEFSEHKKIIDIHHVDLGAGYKGFYSDSWTKRKTGTAEIWVKVDNTSSADIILREGGTIICQIWFTGNDIYIYDGAVDTDCGDYAVDTWYHFKIEWRDDDTYDVYMNNVLIANNFDTRNGMTDGIDRWWFRTYHDGGHQYIDAVSHSWTSGNEIGDNWTYDYHAYSYDDDTANVVSCIGYVNPYTYRTLNISFEASDYDKDKHFFQIYDKDSILGFEGEIKVELQEAALRTYYCESTNKAELEEQMNETMTSSKIYEMLETLTPSTNTRLHLGDYDLDTDTYSPTIINLPRVSCYMAVGYAGNKVIRIKPNGIIEYHSGAATGLSITEASSEIANAPTVRILQNTYTKVTVYGGIDPDTGTRFSGSAGSGTPEFWKRLNYLKSDTDCGNMATAILADMTSPKKINLILQGIGAYSAYDTITLSYSIGDLIISSDTWYILSQVINYCTANARFILSNGVLEDGEYQLPSHTESEEISDDISKTIYDTDLNTVYVAQNALSGSGSTESNDMIHCNADGEASTGSFYISDYVDETRPVYITYTWARVDANADTVDGWLVISYAVCDGTDGLSDSGEGNIDFDLPASAANMYVVNTYEMDPSLVFNNAYYRADWYLKEAREVYVVKVTISYYVKRTF